MLFCFGMRLKLFVDSSFRLYLFLGFNSTLQVILHCGFTWTPVV